MKSKVELLKKVMKTGLKPIKKMTVSEWADTYRVLSQGAAEPGKWKTSRAEYQRAIMDAFTDNNVHRVVVKSCSQIGKALWTETPIMTTEGFKLMGELEVGDKVFDERGKVCEVIAATEIMYNRPCYEVTFSDGAKIIADANHLWQVQDGSGLNREKTRIITTLEMSQTYKTGKRNRYSIPVAKPLSFNGENLPIAPYTLGVYLGDGHSYSGQITLHRDDIEITGRTKAGHCAECHRQHSLFNKWKRILKNSINPISVDPIIDSQRTFSEKLRGLNLLKNKHIPPEYLRSSYEQRQELLQGLMDTDGSISKKSGRCEITQKSYLIAEGIMELLRSLGFKPTIRQKIATCRYKGKLIEVPVYRITFLAYAETPVFKLQRKLKLQKNSEDCRVTETTRRRIVKVKPVGSVPVRCIQVNSESHLYLAGKELIPTHNSDIMNNVIGRMAHLDPCTIMMIQPTVEMAQDFSKSRVAPMIKDTKVLSEVFGAYKTRDTNQTILSKFFIGGRLVFCGSNSPAGLASRPIRILLCDEVDRFAISAGDEGDPVDLASKRMRHRRLRVQAGLTLSIMRGLVRNGNINV